MIDEDINLEAPSGAELHGSLENPREGGVYYMGGVNNGRGFGRCNFIAFVIIMLILKYDIIDTAMENHLDELDNNANDFEIVEVEFSDNELENGEDLD